MTCRFCGTVVPAPPCDCPKCGRPVTAADISKAVTQAAAATVVFRKEEKQTSSPKLFAFIAIALAVVITISAVAWSRYSRARQGDLNSAGVTLPPPAQLQEQNKPSAANMQAPPQIAPASVNPVGGQPREEQPDPPPPTGPNVEEIAEKAQSAFDRGDWVSPPQDNALKWARESHKLGSAQGAKIEEQIYARMLESLENSRKSHDYPGALEQVNEMIRLFPNHTSLPSVKGAIQREQSNNQ